MQWRARSRPRASMESHHVQSCRRCSRPLPVLSAISRFRPLPAIPAILPATMPELPEVETVRRSLIPALVSRSITGVTLRDFPGVIGSMDFGAFAVLVQDRRIEDIRRRGKYLLIDFDDGSG